MHITVTKIPKAFYDISKFNCSIWKLWGKPQQTVRHRQEVPSCVRKILNLMFLQHSFWELGFEKENLIVDKSNNLLLVHVCQLFMVSQLSVFWTYQTGACGGKNKKFWRRKNNEIQNLAFVNFRWPCYIYALITIFMLYVTQPFRSLEGLYLL